MRGEPGLQRQLPLVQRAIAHAAVLSPLPGCHLSVLSRVLPVPQEELVSRLDVLVGEVHTGGTSLDSLTTAVDATVGEAKEAMQVGKTKMKGHREGEEAAGKL